MPRILQLDRGYDQDDDYVAEEEESLSSSDYSSTTTDSEDDDDDEEKNVSSERRNSQRLQKNIKTVTDKTNQQKIRTRRQNPQPQKTNRTQTRSGSETLQKSGLMAEEEKPKRKRGRPPKDPNLTPSPLQRGRGRPPATKTEPKSAQVKKPTPQNHHQLFPQKYLDHQPNYDSNLSSTPVTCPKCRKPYKNADALKNHAFWCENSTRMTRSKRTGSTSSNSKKVVKQNKKTKLTQNANSNASTHRGRPDKANLSNDPYESPLYQQVSQTPELRNEVHIPNLVHDGEDKFSLMPTESESEIDELNNSSQVETNNADDDGPASCPKCHARYRKLVSLLNHMPTCVGSGSEEEDEEGEENADESCDEEFESNEIHEERIPEEVEAPAENQSHPLQLPCQPSQPPPPIIAQVPSPKINYAHLPLHQESNSFRIQQEQLVRGQPETQVLPPPLPQTITLGNHISPPTNVHQNVTVKDGQRMQQQLVQQYQTMQLQQRPPVQQQIQLQQQQQQILQQQHKQQQHQILLQQQQEQLPVQQQQQASQAMQPIQQHQILQHQMVLQQQPVQQQALLQQQYQQILQQQHQQILQQQILQQHQKQQQQQQQQQQILLQHQQVVQPQVLLQQQQQQQLHSRPQNQPQQPQQEEMTTILQDTVTGQLYRINIPIPFHQTQQPTAFTLPRQELQVNASHQSGDHHPVPQPSQVGLAQVQHQQHQHLHCHNHSISQPTTTVVSSSSTSPLCNPTQLQHASPQLTSIQLQSLQQQQLQMNTHGRQIPNTISSTLPPQILHSSFPTHISQSQPIDYPHNQQRSHQNPTLFRSNSSTFVPTFPFMQRPLADQNMITDNSAISMITQQLSTQLQQQHPLSRAVASPTTSNNPGFSLLPSQHVRLPQVFPSPPPPSQTSDVPYLSAVESNGNLSPSLGKRSIHPYGPQPRLPHPHQYLQHQSPAELNLTAHQQLQLAQQRAFHQQQLYQNQSAQQNQQFISLNSNGSMTQSPSLQTTQLSNSFGPSQPQLLQHSIPNQPAKLEPHASIHSLPTSSSVAECSGMLPVNSPSTSRQINEAQHPVSTDILQPQLLKPSQIQIYHQQQHQLQQNAMLESLQRQVQLQALGHNLGSQVHHLSSTPQPHSSHQIATTSFQLQFPSGGIVLREQQSNQGVEKYRKVTASHVLRPIEPKPAPQDSLEAATTSQSPGNLVKSHLANMVLQKNQNQFINSNQSEPHLNSFLDPQTQRKNPILTAVVRPMEHPLQKLSHQISQIESTFNSLTSTGGGVIQQPNDVPISHPVEESLPEPVDDSNSHGTISQIAPTPMASTPTIASTQSHSTRKTLEAARPPLSILQKPRPTPTDSEEIPRPRQKKKAMTSTNSSPSKAGVALSPPKPIQLTLKRNERGGSYSVKHISQTKPEANSKFKNLKITARIASGELEGTMTNVVVEPKIHLIPIPDQGEGDEGDSNLTIQEDGEGASSVIPSIPVDYAGHGDAPKLAYRAVVVYEVSHGSTVIFRSSDVRAIWCQIFETAQGTRHKRNLPPISYPATTVSLVHMFNMLGLTHRAVQFLLNHLPQPDKETPFKELPLRKEVECDNESGVDKVNDSGCARTEGYTGRKPFDMFGWLASKHRKPLEKMSSMGEEIWKPIGLPLAQRYRNLKERTEKTLVVMWSIIHGRGLYTRRDIDKGDIIIEYAGEVVRSPVCDQREKFYETKGIGCYMFRIDDEYIIDATMKGNAARFINHSCDPNCESKSLRMSGTERIVILALRKIFSGEELTYDYKFEKEENKIPCACASRKCRKYLN